MHVWWLLPLLFVCKIDFFVIIPKIRIFSDSLDFCLGFPLSKPLMRWDWDGRLTGRAAFSWSKAGFTSHLKWLNGLLLVHLFWISQLMRILFWLDGMTLRTPTGSPCKCKIILREASLGQQSVHWAPQLWSALRNIFIYLRFWEHLLETGYFSWMVTSSFLSGMVTPAWSDMQLLGGSTWPVQAQGLIGGTCLGISPFISNGNQSLRQKSNIWYRQRRIWSVG